MSSLYQLSAEYNELFEKLIESGNNETGEIDEAIANALSFKKEEAIEKSESVAYVVRKMGVYEDEITAEIERLTAMKKSVQGAKERLKRGLGETLQLIGIQKIDGIKAKISFRKSEKTIVDNLEDIPDEYKTVKISYSPKLTEIKEAIKSGTAVKGAHIEICQNLQIK